VKWVIKNNTVIESYVYYILYTNEGDRNNSVNLNIIYEI